MARRKHTKTHDKFRDVLFHLVRDASPYESTEQRRARLERAAKHSDISLDRLCALELAYLSYFRGIDTPHTATAADYDMANRYLWAM